MPNEKVKPENLTASARSPVIPVVKETDKAFKAKDFADKAEKNAQGKAEELVKGELNTAPKTTENTEKPAQSPEKKPKKPKKDQPSASGSEHSETLFPASIRINTYGFLYMGSDLLDSLGWHKGMELKLDKNADGSVTVAKA